MSLEPINLTEESSTSNLLLSMMYGFKELTQEMEFGPQTQQLLQWVLIPLIPRKIQQETFKGFHVLNRQQLTTELELFALGQPRWIPSDKLTSRFIVSQRSESHLSLEKESMELQPAHPFLNPLLSTEMLELALSRHDSFTLEDLLPDTSLYSTFK